MKNICLLGATGSIGQSTLDIIKANSNEYCLTAFSFNQNIDKARQIINEFKKMGYDLGLVSVTFRDKTPREILVAMKEAGLKVIEWGSDVHAPCRDREGLGDRTRFIGIRNRFVSPLTVKKLSSQFLFLICIYFLQILIIEYQTVFATSLCFI